VLAERYGANVISGETNPTLRRRELGFLLRKLRTDRGLSMDEVTERLLFSATKLSRLETGRSGASPRDIRDMCDLYQIAEPERARLMALAREGKRRAWWQEYDLAYGTYVGLEAEAIAISDYNSDVVTGLLQIDSYARAMLEANEPPLDRTTIEQRVEARIKRQDLLDRDDGPRFHYVIDEAALRRPIGGPAVMRRQLERIIEVAGLPKVTFQIIPIAIGAHPALDSNFVILEFEGAMVNDVVYVEGLVGNIYLEATADLQRYKQVFSRLQSVSLSPEASVAFAENVAAAYGNAA
jgi:transcriptional regulator with XRE-family HTH domain